MLIKTHEPYLRFLKRKASREVGIPGLVSRVIKAILFDGEDTA